MSDKTLWIGVAVIIIAFFGFVIYQRAFAPESAHAFDTLAQCLTDKDVKMYGAEWCHNCKKQKEAFGNSYKKLNYIECPLPSGMQGQTQECDEAGIDGYPTWTFPDGTRLKGYQTLKALADKVDCPLE